MAGTVNMGCNSGGKGPAKGTPGGNGSKNGPLRTSMTGIIKRGKPKRR